MSEKIRVLLVDDSAVVRGMVQRALRNEAALEIVATAANGQLALDTLAHTPVDVVVLDLEMPVMDGLSALPKIIALAPHTRVIMASTLTVQNAEISLRALALGAADYIAKPSTSSDASIEDYFAELIVKVKALAPTHKRAVPPLADIPISAQAKTTVLPRKAITLIAPSKARVEALAIASSTGGPQALMQIFAELKGRTFHVPVFITQHMPASFTAILAKHISTSFGGPCREATDGEEVKSGIIYLAPGDFHLTIERHAGVVRMRLDQNEPENFCRPSADSMLRSLAQVYGSALLALVLTGLGADGANGVKAVAAAKGTAWAQDEASSVVYGMPRAAAETGALSAVLPLDKIAQHFQQAGII